MNNVFFTSFQRSHDLPGGIPKFSVAVQWPSGYEDLPRVEWALILDAQGRWIRPRNFYDADRPLEEYRDRLYMEYLSRKPIAQQWLSQQGDFAMLCWCPYDRAAQRQILEWGSFVCHTGVLAEFMEKELGCQVWLDGDRRRMKELG